MTPERKPLVKLAELWQRTSAAGNVYYSGFMGGCTLLMFDDGEHPHPTREGETVHVWKFWRRSATRHNARRRSSAAETVPHRNSF
jgi:hypothetical protein